MASNTNSTVYGPVPSWRLGSSLGIDVLKPPKTCTFNCVYCQLGPTVRQVSSPDDIGDFIGVTQVLRDLENALERLDLQRIDTITFSGTGEPTLNPHLGDMIAGVGYLANGVPIAVLTNSSLMFRPEVRENLSKADIVVAKLDAANAGTFHAINRPLPHADFNQIVGGIKLFRNEASALLALQIMFIDASDDVIPTNFSGRSLDELLKLVSVIHPDQVQINTPTRPPSESHVKKVDSLTLRGIYEKFSDIIGKERVLLIERPKRVKGPPVRLTRPSIESRVLELLKRRPCRICDIAASLGLPPSEVRRIVRTLEKRGLVSSKRFGKERFSFALQTR